MPDYKYTGDVPRIMNGLIQGHNATVSDGDWFTPDGSTVVCSPGALLHTDEPYPHAELAELDGEPTFDAGAELPSGLAEVTNNTGTPETVTPSTAPDAEPTTEQEPTA